jgi:hypothetical protein
MSSAVRRLAPAVLLGLAAAGLVAADPPGARKPAEPAESPADRTRQALDQTVTLDFVGQTLHDVVTHLRQKTKIPFVLDLPALNRIDLNPHLGFVAADGQPLPLTLTVDRGKLRPALRAWLKQYGLDYVILGDSVLVSTEATALRRQMRQPVSLDVEAVPLGNVLKQLARATATNVVLDPRAAKEAQAAVTARFEDVPLENAVRLVADMGGLGSVQVDNVLYVTTEERAVKLRSETSPRSTPSSTRNLVDPALRQPNFGPGGAALGGGKGKKGKAGM